MTNLASPEQVSRSPANPVQSIERPHVPTPTSLVAEARERAQEFEDAHQISSDYATKLKESGVFRTLVPTDCNGLGGSLTDWLRLVRDFAYADASAGWIVGHGAIASAIIAASATPKFASEFFAESSTTSALSNLSRATAKPVDGGYLVTGRWGFMTSCTSADYIGGMVKVLTDDETTPPPITVVMPKTDVAIDYTWQPVGLAATGSHEVEATEVFVPTHRTFEWPRPWLAPEKEGRISALRALVPGTWLISICPAATHLGLARRALDEASASLEKKRDSYTGKRILENPAVLRKLEEAESTYMLCSAAMEQNMSLAWQEAIKHDALDEKLRRQLRLVSTATVQRTHEIVQTAFEACGAAAISRGGVMQKLLRDASCLISHVSTNPGSFEVTGKAHHGLEPPRWL